MTGAGVWRRCVDAGRGLALAFALTGPAAAETVAIVNADLYTMTEAGRIPGASVIVTDGRITGLGADIAVPEGARVIDSGGQPVTPGLIASATQVGLVEVSSSDDADDRSGAGGPLGAAFSVRHGLNPNSTLIPIARTDGLTHGIVIPGGSSAIPFEGSGVRIHLGGGPGLLEDAYTGQYASIHGGTTSAAGQSRSAQWIALRQALKAAAGMLKRKDSPTMSLDAFRERAELLALEPVLTRTAPLVLRVKRESDIREAVAIGEAFDIRVVVIGANEAWRVADLLAERGVPVILDPLENLPGRFDEIGSRQDNAALLHAAGVAIGFYASPLHLSHNAGLEMRQAAGIAVANGLPWDAALAAMTSVAARIWGMDGHAGSLEPGGPADLVVWSGDPLEVTTYPVAVLVHGEVASLDHRQKRLRDRYHPRPEQQRD